MLTKGMLMVISGIGGLVITVTGAITLFVIMRKKELRAQNEAADFIKISSSSVQSSSFSKNGTDFLPESGTGTDVLQPEKGTGTGTGTDVIATEQKKAASGTDVLGQKGTEVIVNKTTIIDK